MTRSTVRNFLTPILSLCLSVFCLAAPQFEPQISRDPTPSAEERRIQHEQEKGRNKERQKNMKADTEKLFELAEELKHYVEQTNAEVISLDVVRKAEQIEKLARSVKDKAKGI